jgi:hypothetical protein
MQMDQARVKFYSNIPENARASIRRALWDTKRGLLQTCTHLVGLELELDWGIVLLFKLKKRAALLL